MTTLLTEPDPCPRPPLREATVRPPLMQFPSLLLFPPNYSASLSIPAGRLSPQCTVHSKTSIKGTRQP